MAARKGYTLIVDLSQDFNSIMSRFSKNTRYEINRCKREGVEVRFHEADEIRRDESIAEDFAKMHRSLYSQKGLASSMSSEYILDCASTGCMMISEVLLDGLSAVVHVWLIENEESKLMYSVSEHRKESKEKQAAIGRANRYLWYKDFEWLKSSGHTRCDVGGMTTLDKEKMNGIDKFKAGFGGEGLIQYGIIIPKSIKGKIALFKWIIEGKDGYQKVSRFIE